MKTFTPLKLGLLLMVAWLLQPVSAQNILWEADFGSEDDFARWQVVDANADGVTWNYEAGGVPSPVVYRYHYTNSGDDWLISPAITVTEAAQLMAKYSYVGSFYSEEMEVYYGDAPRPEAMKRLAVHTDLKDKAYESYVFFAVEAGDTFHLAFRATSPAYKQQLFLTAVQVARVGNGVAEEYPNRVVTPSGLTLAATEKYVQADSGTQVDLAVFDGSQDVTDSAQIYVQTPAGVEHVLETSQYVCTEVGEYRFYARYAEKSSADVPLRLQAMHRLPPLPRDEQPMSDEFLRRVLVLQGTGVQCVYCPNGIAALWRFFAGHEEADRVCHIAYHSYTESDPLYCEAAEILSSQTQLRAYPNMMVNSNPEWGDTGLSEDGFVTFLNESVDKALEGTSSTNIALATAYDAERRVISVNVGVKPSETGLYRLTVALLQDSVFCRQSGATSVDFYTHNASVRAIAPADGEGAYLNCGMGEEAGRVYQYACEFGIGELVQDTYADYPFSVERHARVVAYVRRMDGLVDNVVACAMNDSVGFAYTSIAPEVPPVGICENVADAAMQASTTEVYDMVGHKIGQGSGGHPVTRGLPKGLYLLREKVGEDFRVRKVYVP